VTVVKKVKKVKTEQKEWRRAFADPTPSSSAFFKEPGGY
jgi:hypothetical protein